LLLDPELRPRSVLLQQTLEGAKNRLAAGEPVPEIEKWALEQLTQPDFNPEYFSIVNGENLLPPDPATLPDLVVACTAVWAGKVRLIDNLVLRGSL
ncbi:MAG: pantoate--beta-alanine ligase, partial [Bacteroidetes bacterium]